MNLSIRLCPAAAGRCITLLCALALADAASAEERDTIVTDRPDFVESSAVVRDGRFQLEGGLGFERKRRGTLRERGSSTPLLLRYGVGEAWELRLETDGRSVLRSDDSASGASTRESGYADLSLGLKWHQRDGGGALPAIGWLVHVDVDSGSPALRGRGLRPSLRMVLEWELAGDWSLGVMPGLAAERDEAGQRYGAAIAAVTLSKAWTERWRTFAELAAPRVAGARHGGTVASLDLGTAYLWSDQVQIDTALARGLNRRAADLSWSFGLSAKF
jgi:hypothetical protein